MYSTISYQMAQDRIAGLQHQAQRDAVARAARPARRADENRSGHRTPRRRIIAARRALIALGARS